MAWEVLSPDRIRAHIIRTAHYETDPALRTTAPGGAMDVGNSSDSGRGSAYTGAHFHHDHCCHCAEMNKRDWISTKRGYRCVHLTSVALRHDPVLTATAATSWSSSSWLMCR